MSEHETELLGAYVLGVLDESEQQTLQEHLAGCDDCRRELTDLQEMEAALGEVPPEAFLDGPPADGDLLLQRTIRQVRGERTRRDRVRRTSWVAAAAAVVAVVLAGGVLVGRGFSSSEPNGPTALPGTTSASLPPGSRSASGTDATTGATMTVSVRPAAGWVRLSTMVSGVAAGQECRLYVVAKDGSRREAGSWLVSEAGARNGTPLDSFALVAPDDVASVLVETFAGQPLISVPV